MRLKMAICLSAVMLLSMLLSGCSQANTSVPIKVENANHLRELAFNLLYDTTVLEVSGVGMTDLTRMGSVRWGVQEPGKLLVLLAGEDINGGGTLVVVKCNVPGSTGVSTLTIQVLEAYSTAGELLEPQVSEGSLSAEDKSVVPPVIIFGS